VKESTAVAAAVGVEEEEVLMMILQANKEPEKEYILKSSPYSIFP
jgi:hypothetical protein